MQSRPSGRVSLPGNDGPNNAKGGSKDPNNQSPRAAHGSQPSQSVSSQGRQMLIEPMSACEPFGDLGAGIDGEGGGGRVADHSSSSINASRCYPLKHSNSAFTNILRDLVQSLDGRFSTSISALLVANVVCDMPPSSYSSQVLLHECSGCPYGYTPLKPHSVFTNHQIAQRDQRPEFLNSSNPLPTTTSELIEWKAWSLAILLARVA